MLPASRYKEARRNAVYHVQVELIGPLPMIDTPGKVKVKAQVATVFRGSTSLKVGDQVTFEIAVTRKTDHPDSLPYGGQIWTDFDKLEAARFMEVFLNGEPPDCEVALWQSKLINSVTTSPLTNK